MSFADIFGSQGAPLPEEDQNNQDHSFKMVKETTCSPGNLSPCNNFYSEDDDYFPHPPAGKRLAPVGAASNEDEVMDQTQAKAVNNLIPPANMSTVSSNNDLEERLRVMEEEQEEMNESLMSLTSHFAKVNDK